MMGFIFQQSQFTSSATALPANHGLVRLAEGDTCHKSSAVNGFWAAPPVMLRVSVKERQVGTLVVAVRRIIIPLVGLLITKMPSSMVFSLSSIKAKISDGPGKVVRNSRFYRHKARKVRKLWHLANPLVVVVKVGAQPAFDAVTARVWQ